MKKYPKLLQIDKRGQIVIPKDIRQELDIDEGTGFWAYTLTDEGILLKKVNPEPLENQEKIISELDEKSDKVKIKKSNIARSIDNYKKTKKGNLEIL